MTDAERTAAQTASVLSTLQASRDDLASFMHDRECPYKNDMVCGAVTDHQPIINTEGTAPTRWQQAAHELMIKRMFSTEERKLMWDWQVSVGKRMAQ